MGEARHALIVAASKYRDTRLPPLGAPGQDAKKLREVLRNAEIGGFEVELSLNSGVQKLRRTLESFFAKRARDDLLLVHFSGHGLKDDEGQLYLAAADTEVDLLRATALDAEWLRQLMNDCRSEKIAVFLDCCFGGAFATNMVHKVGVDVPGIKEHLGGAGRVVITASNAVQYAFEGGNMVGAPEASVFTEALVSGLVTGEADRNDDGLVTINELFEYLADKVHETSPNQTPTKWEFNAFGDWVIAASRRANIKLLSADLQALMASPDPVHRLAAVSELGVLLASPDSRISGSAELAVRQLATDDSDKVKAAAKHLLATKVVPAPATVVEPTPTSPTDNEPPVEVEDAPVSPPVEAKGPVGTTDRPDLLGMLPDATEAERMVAQLVRERAERIEAEAPTAEDARLAAEWARLRAQALRRRNMAIGIGGGVVAVGLLAAVAWIGCVGRDCGPSASPTGGSAANGSGGPVGSASGGSSGGPVVDVPSGTFLYSVRVKDVAGTANDDWDIWAIESDGSNERAIVTAPGRQTDPAWAPDGSDIVYADSTAGLQIATATGELVDQFTNNKTDVNPISALDGTIAFTRVTSKGNYDIYSLSGVHPEGSPTPLTTNGANDWDPSWSPSGDRITFVSERVSPKAIYTMDANGDNQRPLTEDGGFYDDPAWSPVGDVIAVTRAAAEGGTKSIWLVPIGGGNPKRLTHSDANESDPTWSRDGRAIAFSRGGAIVVVNLEGTVIGTLLSSAGPINWPEWH